MIEKPQGLTTACDGEETVIDVLVIAKPTIKFNQTGTVPAYLAAGCYTDATKADAKYDFPITITTSSSQVEVDYTIERKDLYTDAVTPYRTVTGEKVSGGMLNIEFDDYGEYKVTITKVTDRIARKCDVLGELTDATKIFTYSVLPQPKAGKAYHVPNNF
jgi:hypothetical protein